MVFVSGAFLWPALAPTSVNKKLLAIEKARWGDEPEDRRSELPSGTAAAPAKPRSGLTEGLRGEAAGAGKSRPARPESPCSDHNCPVRSAEARAAAEAIFRCLPKGARPPPREQLPPECDCDDCESVGVYTSDSGTPLDLEGGLPDFVGASGGSSSEPSRVCSFGPAPACGTLSARVSAAH